jgi:two-component system, LytTR family, response regulator
MENRLKVGFIDDEEAALNKFLELFNQFSEFELGFATMDPFEGFLKAKNREIDILITDVMIPKMGGLEITERLGEIGMPVILCSANDSYGANGYQLDAVYFMSKPLKYNDMSKGLKKARELLEGPDSVLTTEFADIRVVNSNGGITGEHIRISQIVYIEQSGNYTQIYLDKESKVIVSTLRETIQNIDNPNILQIHRSFAINIHRIKRIFFSEIELNTGKKIPIGNIYKEKIIHRLSFKKL